MTAVSLSDLSAVVDGTTILDALDLDVASGEVLGIVGPNGSGKSTALRCVYRALRPTSGVVRVDSFDVWVTKPREVARQVAALTQDSGSELDFTVSELIELGRAPHRRGNAALTARERDVCQAAMLQMGVLHLADRGVLGLSGGERQRVLIARALAQEPQLLVLDEPTNHLDLRHQIELLRALRRVAATTLVVLHDLNLAAAACDRLALLSRGRLVAIGRPSDVLTPELLAEVYGVDVSVVEHPETGHPQVLLTIDPPDTPRARTAPADSEGFR